MIDISFTGDGYVEIEAGDVINTRITDFPADGGNPIEVNEVEVVGHRFTLNRQLFRWRKPAAYIVRVSVIPGSANDESLEKLLRFTHLDTDVAAGGFGGDDLSEYDVAMTIVTRTKSYNFSDGNILKGSPSISVDQEGKMQPKIYTFVFGCLK